MYLILPNKTLNPQGSISAGLIDMGFDYFHQVCNWIWRSPYGRTRDSQNYLNVIKEQKGTCSTKHAFLKILADELGIKVELTMGIYAMTQAKQPFHYTFIQNLFGLEQAKAVWKIRAQCIKALSEQ